MAESAERWTARVARADENHRRYWHELKNAWGAIQELKDDPGRTHQAFTAIENFPLLDLLNWHTKQLSILKDPEIMRLWKERSLPDLSTGAALAMKRLPEGTLGHEYAKFVEARQLDNIFLEYLQIDSLQKFFVYRVAHLHDLFHFILGYDPYDPIGEMEVEAFLHAQSGALNHVLFLLGYVRFLLRNHPGSLWQGRHRLLAARALGKETPRFLLLRWEDLMNEPLDKVRKQLGIAHRPQLPAQPRPKPKGAPSLAHVVYNVPDLARAVTYYQEVFGYEITAHDRRLGVTFLSDGTDHHTLALQECLSFSPWKLIPSMARGFRRLVGLVRGYLTSGSTQRPRALPPLAVLLHSLTPGLNHIGYRLADEADLRAYYYLLQAKGVAILWAVNHGDMLKSFYIRDPGGNICELFVDGEQALALKARRREGASVEEMHHDDVPTYALDLLRELGIQPAR